MEGAHVRIDGHEALCAERWRVMNDKMNAVLGTIGVLVMSLLGWMAVQLYSLEPLRDASYTINQHSVSIRQAPGNPVSQ